MYKHVNMVLEFCAQNLQSMLSISRALLDDKLKVQHGKREIYLSLSYNGLTNPSSVRCHCHDVVASHKL